jgi:predicted dehydrogenase
VAVTTEHLLVLGAGSVGKRHMRNLAALGCRISAMDPREDRLDETAEQLSLESRYADLESAMVNASTYSGVVVCSPPAYHVDQCFAALRARLPVLLEKPVSPDLASARRLADEVLATGVPLLLAYTYRWWPPVRDLRARVHAGEIGSPRHVRCTMSAHLADWHPWERYQDFFMASRELGGGALLDESHFIDLMLWIFGRPTSVFARVEKLSDLEIETDDNVDAWFAHDGGPRIGIHLDLYGRPHERSITVAGARGTLRWSYEENRLSVGTVPEARWQHHDYQAERNDMFTAAAREFVAILRHECDVPTCTIEDGVRVLEVIEAMRASSRSGSVVTLA